MRDFSELKILVNFILTIDLIDNILEDASSGKYLIRLKKKDFHHNFKDVQTVIFAFHVNTIRFDMASQ